MNWEAFWLTVRLATIVSFVLLAIGIPVAYWLTYSRWRWKFLVEAAVALPLISAADRAGLLCAGGARFAQSDWALVGVADRPHAGLHV